jgi:hypothetical protein
MGLSKFELKCNNSLGGTLVGKSLIRGRQSFVPPWGGADQQAQHWE